MSNRNIVFVIIWVGLVILIPLHLLKMLFYMLRAYIQMAMYVSIEPLQHFYDENIKLYEEKKKALQDYDAFF